MYTSMIPSWLLTTHVVCLIQDCTTALIVAARHNNCDVIEELLKAGANCHHQSKVIHIINVAVVK